MPYHYFYTGAQLDSLRQGYRWMQRTGLSAKAVKHKLWKTFGEPDVRRWTETQRCPVGYGRFPYPAYRLFGVWEAALGFVLFFRRFCEFVLPYRIEREPLEFWQEAYVRRYGRLCDSLCAVNPDVVFVASALNDHLRAEQNWYASSDLSFVEYGALQLLDERFRRLPGVVGVQCGPVPGIGDPFAESTGWCRIPTGSVRICDIYGGYRRTKASLPVELL